MKKVNKFILSVFLLAMLMSITAFAYTFPTIQIRGSGTVKTSALSMTAGQKNVTTSITVIRDSGQSPRQIGLTLDLRRGRWYGSDSCGSITRYIITSPQTYYYTLGYKPAAPLTTTNYWYNCSVSNSDKYHLTKFSVNSTL